MHTVNGNGVETTSDFNRDRATINTGSGENASLTSQISEQAQQALEVTKKQGSQLANQALNQVTTRLTDQKNSASNTLNQVAGAVRRAGEELREQTALSGYANNAADAVENFSNYIRTSDLQDLQRDLESVARRQPALFLGGAFTLGLLLGRFLRSSGSNTAADTGVSYATAPNRPHAMEPTRAYVTDPLLPVPAPSSAASL